MTPIGQFNQETRSIQDPQRTLNPKEAIRFI
jgi:hypothetical protein